MFFLNSHTRYEDITDGAAYTLFVGEKLSMIPGQPDLGWMSGTRATLRNTGVPLNITGNPLEWLPASVDVPVPAYGVVTPQPAANGAPDSAAASDAASAPQPGATPAPAKPLSNKPLPKPTDVGGFGSYHPGLVGFLLGDGSIHWLRDDIDATTLRRLGNRADGELIDKDF